MKVTETQEGLRHLKRPFGVKQVFLFFQLKVIHTMMSTMKRIMTTGDKRMYPWFRLDSGVISKLILFLFISSVSHDLSSISRMPERLITDVIPLN